MELLSVAIQCASTHSILLMYRYLSLMTGWQGRDKYRILNLSFTSHLSLMGKGKHSTLIFFMMGLVSTLLICYGVFILIYSPKYRHWITEILISI
jgi:hypothetical protein